MAGGRYEIQRFLERFYTNDLGYSQSLEVTSD